MSELLNVKEQRQNFRRHLLANVSMLALLGYLGVSQKVLAADDDPPTIWIELGGQAEQVDGEHKVFAPPFVIQAPAADREPMIDAQKPSKFSIGGESKITFDPHNSDWVFSVGVRYGKSDTARHKHQQTPYPRHIDKYLAEGTGGTQAPQPADELFGDGQTSYKESHTVIDFQAGKDVGLGMFGSAGTSVFSAGVRFAQFITSSDVSLKARPEYKIFSPYTVVHNFPPTTYGHTRAPIRYRVYAGLRHTYAASIQTKRNTHAVGPSLSWDASLPVAGNGSDMTLSVDWGLNGAVLFGRQRARVTHQTAGQYHREQYRHRKYGTHVNTTYAHGPYDQDRSRMAIIPNAGAMAAVSLKFSDIHFSAGYRADFFFNAMDTGVDVRKLSTLGFYGPFATISYGFGG
jgi:hypothetical protein